ncbi:unnamed protein product [Mesocestoides corti]|uniref:RanBD1 domain-containing protein n=1 Tax=Mesocestoides corti TaxID=53468 RepID=A0A0R3U107_MESCO|nr:unnamed protein product [Mesocestoides corti]
MSKRGADKPLDYNNWDAPDVPDKADVFEKADEATIRARNIIVARRKSAQLVTQTKRGLFKSLDVFGGYKDTTTATPVISSSKTETKDDNYLSKLAILNKEVSAWISKHVSEDPYCILTPIFNDYAKHLASIESSTNTSPPSEPDAQSNTTVSENKSASVPAPSSLKPAASNGFNFSFQPTSSSGSSEAPKPVFSFGLATSSLTTSQSSATPIFSFNPTSLKTDDSKLIPSEPADNEEYVPPKPEVKEIKEEGSVFTIRCKLFYKKSDQWTERGLGNLHIIPSGDDKFQLLVRADTNLGNILLNIMVTKDIPMQLQKNNITFACVPSPPLPGASQNDEATSSPRPVPMLIRVKNDEAAENLLSEIEKHRGKKSD